MAEERRKKDDRDEAFSRAKMGESSEPESVGVPTNSRTENPNPNPNPDDFMKNTDHAEAIGNGGNKGRSCKGCLFYSSQLKSNSRNPLCVGVSRSIPNAPRYIVGKSEMEASKEGKVLRDFRYGCIGYSLYADQKKRTSDTQESEPELPVCIGLEVLVDRKIKEPLPDGNRLPQHRSPQPSNVSREEFLSRFSRNANLIANQVVKNVRRVGNQIKRSVDDILYPYRKRPK